MPDVLALLKTVETAELSVEKILGTTDVGTELSIEPERPCRARGGGIGFFSRFAMALERGGRRGREGDRAGGFGAGESGSSRILEAP